ncbi:MAG: DUF680 domain-containing protein [Mesorhizobium sp.]|nr:MAG: DUF680 domain-containing protein [Mesorhizobium sp.]
MKKTILTLAAVLALSGMAFAGQSQPGKQAPQAPQAPCADTSIKLDCGATGSVEKAGSVTRDGSTEKREPRLGIDIDPWIVPSTF